MCTLTWIHENDGYQLLCNRDEKRTRKPASPPVLAVRNGVRFLAPVDGDFGGTWIATNEFGVSACLLNGANGNCTNAPRSRGLLVLDLIALSSATGIGERVQSLDLFAYAPFTLAALEPGQPAAVIEWNGSRKTILLRPEPRFMLTSSSFDSVEVRKMRHDEYSHLTNSGYDADVLFAFHRSHGPAPSAYSTCMHRPDAETVSFSWIRVSGAETAFIYSPAAPCRWEVSASQALRLTRKSVQLAATRRDA